MSSVLILSLFLISIATTNGYEHLIEICDEFNFMGECKSIWLTSGICFNLSDVHFQRRIVSMNTHNSCVRLYSKKDCKKVDAGDSLMVAPGTPCHYDLHKCGNNFGRKAISAILCNL